MTTPHDKALEAATKAWMDDRGIDSDISRWRDSIDIAISAYLSSIGGVIVPVEPTDELLRSMAIRYDHGLGVPGYYDQRVFGAENVGHARRMESTIRTMRQLHEEVVGKGFYQPPLHAPIPEAGNGGDGWNHDMDAAPKDKTPVIIAVLHKDNDAYFVGEAYFDPAHYGDGDWWWAGSSHGDYHGGPISEINYHGPSAWRPLPAPPSTPSHEGMEKEGKPLDLNITKEWFEKRAALEGDNEISAGLPTYIPGFLLSNADRYYSAIIAKLQAHISELSSPTSDIADLQERLMEAENIIKERDDRLALVDRIADLIGLPEDQELDQVAFELWMDQNRADIAALREAGERLLKACDAYDSDELHTDDSICAYSDALEDFRSALQHVAKGER